MQYITYKSNLHNRDLWYLYRAFLVAFVRFINLFHVRFLKKQNFHIFRWLQLFWRDVIEIKWIHKKQLQEQSFRSVIIYTDVAMHLQHNWSLFCVSFLSVLATDPILLSSLRRMKDHRHFIKIVVDCPHMLHNFISHFLNLKCKFFSNAIRRAVVYTKNVYQK